MAGQLDALAIVQEGKLIWQYNGHVLHLMELEANEGKWVSVKVKKVSKPKTPSQLGYYYACILKCFLSGYLDLGWTVSYRFGNKIYERPVNSDDVDEYLKKRAARIDRDGSLVVSGDFDTDHRPWVLKRNMSAEKASQYIHNLLHYIAPQEIPGIRIPDSREYYEVTEVKKRVHE